MDGATLLHGTAMCVVLYGMSQQSVKIYLHIFFLILTLFMPTYQRHPLGSENFTRWLIWNEGVRKMFMHPHCF